MIFFVASALLNEGLIITEPYHRMLVLFCTIGSAITAYKIQRPRREWSDEERQQHQITQSQKEIGS